MVIMKSFVGPLIVLSLLFSTMNACTYTAAVSQTNIPIQRNKPVEATVHKFIFLGFNFDNDEVYQLVEKLKTQCPDGQVRGILTQDMRTMYLLFFFWARDTVAKGYCVSSKAVATNDADFNVDTEQSPARAEIDYKESTLKLQSEADGVVK